MSGSANNGPVDLSSHLSSIPLFRVAFLTSFRESTQPGRSQNILKQLSTSFFFARPLYISTSPRALPNSDLTLCCLLTFVKR